MSPKSKSLSPAELEQYERDGYVVVEDLIPSDQVKALQARLRDYTHGKRSREGLAVQVEPRVLRGEMEVEHPGDAIRKIDGLVESDDLYQALALHPNMVGIMQQILGPDLKLFRNAALLKPPAVGSAKGMHQDSPYWPIRPMDLCSCWYAIDDATVENGCMGAIPGDHTRGELPHVTVTDDFVIEDGAVDASKKVLLPMRAGSGLFFHSLIPHVTEPNRSTAWRRAIALSYMRSTSTHTNPKGGPVHFHISGETFPIAFADPCETLRPDMGTLSDAASQDLDELTARAITSLERASEDLVAWCDRVRDPERPWAFSWAETSLRGANVAASNYILQAASMCGVLDRVLSPEQKQQGSAWIRSMQDEGGTTYTDPALVERKPPAWNDDEENWPPDGAHKEANNQYARGCLRFYDGASLDQLMGPTPPAWPQKGDADVLDWIKTVEPNWSWIGRMFHRLIPWYHEGAVSEALLRECFDYAQSRQDPDTGFWGHGIQTTFKFLITTHDPAELPVPRADRIIHSVLELMEQPDYDTGLFPCEEFDAFYDLAMAGTSAPGYREEEIQKLAAHRVHVILESHRQADRGLSSYVDRCIPTWLKYDMAPALPQGDAFGWGIYGSGLNICVDLLGIADRVPWTGKWRQRDEYDTRVYVEVAQDLGLV